MALTYEPIASTTVSGSSTSTVTFSSISGSYTDLKIVIQGQLSDTYCLMRLNSDTGSNYSRTQLYGNGSTGASGRGSSETAWYPSVGNATTPATTIIDINNYSNTTTNKTALLRMSLSFDAVYASVFLWRSTSAITSISFAVPGANNWVSGSTFTLYGIKSA